MEASSAVAVKLNAVPAVAEAGAVTEKCVAGWLTEIVIDVPLIEFVTVSVAAMV